MLLVEKYIVNHKTGSQEQKQVNVNYSSRKLSKNRIQAKNERLQDNICNQIDGCINSSNRIAFQSKRRDEQKAQRKAKRLNR